MTIVDWMLKTCATMEFGFMRSFLVTHGVEYEYVLIFTQARLDDNRCVLLEAYFRTCVFVSDDIFPNAHTALTFQ